MIDLALIQHSFHVPQVRATAYSMVQQWTGRIDDDMHAAMLQHPSRTCWILHRAAVMRFRAGSQDELFQQSTARKGRGELARP